MAVMRLHGKIGKTDGIVHIKNRSGSQVWIVALDTLSPNDITKARLKKQVS